MPPLPSDLTRELGAPGTSMWDPAEDTPELLFPQSVRVYDHMRRSDGQVASVLRAVTLPLRQTRWRLEGEDVDPRVLAFVEQQLGLGPTSSGQRRRRRQGIDWNEHLRHALLMLPLGFMPFEQVYEAGPPPSGIPGLPNTVAHIRKLAPRMPRSLTEVLVAPDGGLAGVKQQVYRDNAWHDVTIPVDRLVFYVNDREGADWTGTSVLRSAYKHWVIKDKLLRMGPMVVERNGMGVPVVTAPPGGSEEKAAALAKAFRAGEESGAGLPYGYTVQLTGVTGSTRDELPLVLYHDQQLGKNLLAMFLDLGHDAGARSLGDTFVDFFMMALNAVAEEVASTATEHIVRDLVELNFGPDEPYPAVMADAIVAHAAPTAEALGQLAEAGLIVPDSALRDDVRRRYGLPERTEDEPVPDPQVPLGTPEVPPAALSASADLEARLEAALARVRGHRGG